MITKISIKTKHWEGWGVNQRQHRELTHTRQDQRQHKRLFRYSCHTPSHKTLGWTHNTERKQDTEQRHWGSTTITSVSNCTSTSTPSLSLNAVIHQAAPAKTLLITSYHHLRQLIHYHSFIHKDTQDTHSHHNTDMTSNTSHRGLDVSSTGTSRRESDATRNSTKTMR